MKFGRFIILSCAALATPALACSPVKGYRVPSNVELIQQADLVVLAEVESGPDTLDGISADDIFRPRIVLKPIRTIKGEAPHDLRVFGYLKARDGTRFPPFPTSLDQAHPTAFWGACIRQGYSQGALVVAMFTRSSEGYTQLGKPFARAVEDVSSPSAVWVRAADDYAKLLSGPSRGRRSAFEVERRRLIALTDDADAQMIAADIGKYLDLTRAK